MIACPVCPDHPVAATPVGSNCFRCSSCQDLVFVVKDPFEPNREFAAVSNTKTELREIPDDILTQIIVDQSPTTEPPRNMMIEFDDGASIIMIQRTSDDSKYGKRCRKSFDKTAFVFKRNFLHVFLPVELMEQIRAARDGGNVG